MTEHGGTSLAEPGQGLARELVRGLIAGAVAGSAWWLVETAANRAFGGVIPWDAAAIMLALDLAVAMIAGAMLALGLAVAGGGSVAALALGLAAAYGLIRIYEPPGVGGEVVFVAAATVCAVLAVRLAGPRRGWLALAHLTLVTTAAVVIGKAAITANQTSYFGQEEPTGLSLALLLAVLPLVAVVVDRTLGLMVRRDDRRFAAELVLGAVALTMWGRGHAQSTTPLDLPRPAGTTAPAGAPDVILISLDTTRADHMSTYGYARETSPNLTAFAQDALNFTNAHSPAQWTVPGHASMFTGMYPSRHGAHYAGGWDAAPVISGRRRVFPLAADKVTLAEVLQGRGYRTGGFAANFANLDRSFGMAQGFQHYEDHPGLLLRPVPHVVRFVQRFVPTAFKKPFRGATQINAAALAWLDREPADRPAFIFMNYLEPHHWLAAPPFDRWSRDLPNAARLAQKGLFTHRIPAGLDAAEREFVAANYDGQIAAMDVALGELFAALKARGRYENTLLIITADHGELLGEHDEVGHGGRMMYEGLLHIPMVVKFPGSARPRGVSDERVQLVDVLPTVLDTLGEPLPAGVQGEPMQRVTHPTLAEEHINPEFVAYYGAVYNRALRVLYDGPYKLITSSRGEHLLFNLDRDRDEVDDLTSREPERVTTMERQLDAAMRGMDTKVAVR